MSPRYAGRRHALARLVAAAARLGVLPGHPADLDHRHRRAVGEDGRHLQDRLDPVADVVGGRRGEGLGAVAALQHERLTAGGRGHPVASGRRTRPRTPAADRTRASATALERAARRRATAAAGRQGGRRRRRGWRGSGWWWCSPSRIGRRRAPGPRCRGPHAGCRQGVPERSAGSSSSRPRARAKRTSSTRLCRCSLPRVFCTWFCTVRCDRNELGGDLLVGHARWRRAAAPRSRGRSARGSAGRPPGPRPRSRVGLAGHPAELPEHQPGQPGREHRLTARRGPHGLHDLAGGRRLHEVAGGAGLDRGEHVLLLPARRQDEHPGRAGRRGRGTPRRRASRAG